MSSNITLKINGKEKNYPEKSVPEVLKSLKYSTMSMRLVRSLGVTNVRKLVWPTVSAASKRKTTQTHLEITLPPHMSSLLMSELGEEMHIELEADCSKSFEARAYASYDTETSELNFTRSFTDIDRVGQLMKELFQLILTYNLPVNNLDIRATDNFFKVSIDVDLKVPHKFGS